MDPFADDWEAPLRMAFSNGDPIDEDRKRERVTGHPEPLQSACTISVRFALQFPVWE